MNFSQIRKNSQLRVSEDGKRVVVASDSCRVRNILGEDPLHPGNEYTWKLRYQGTTHSLFVGVIDESKFRVGGSCWTNVHCFGNGKYAFGCLSENKTKRIPSELLEIKADLINYTLTIKSMGNSSINLTGTLPRLSGGNYYLYVY
ncbi:hypothetical protein GEMRC1_000376 [Eukaryota sp. GEM-RC1]